MANKFYRPTLPTPAPGSAQVWYDKDSPGFNGYFKWYQASYGRNPSFNDKGLHAPTGWDVPADWTYSSQTGHWYTPAEMQNVGYNLIDGKWQHPNDIRKREIDKENAEIDARIAARKRTEDRFREVNALGRKKTIITGPTGASGSARIKREQLHNSKGVL